MGNLLSSNQTRSTFGLNFSKQAWLLSLASGRSFKLASFVQAFKPHGGFRVHLLGFFVDCIGVWWPRSWKNCVVRCGYLIMKSIICGCDWGKYCNPGKKQSLACSSSYWLHELSMAKLLWEPLGVCGLPRVASLFEC